MLPPRGHGADQIPKLQRGFDSPHPLCATAHVRAGFLGLRHAYRCPQATFMRSARPRHGRLPRRFPWHRTLGSELLPRRGRARRCAARSVRGQRRPGSSQRHDGPPIRARRARPVRQPHRSRVHPRLEKTSTEAAPTAAVTSADVGSGATVRRQQRSRWRRDESRAALDALAVEQRTGARAQSWSQGGVSPSLS